MPTNDEAAEMRGRIVADPGGDEIGTVEEVYLDTDTGKPEWLAVTGVFGEDVSFVPLAGARFEQDIVRVLYEKAQVRDAPRADADGELSQDEEARLYRHYGLDYGEERSGSGLPEGREEVPTADDAITRSEEELHVGVRPREIGRVRMKKHIVAEPVRETVTTEREEARLEREPITEANIDQARRGPELSEEEHEVTLRAEEPVVEKRVVPKERVRLDKDVVSEQESVSADVRKEVVEVDRPGCDRT